MRIIRHLALFAVLGCLSFSPATAQGKHIQIDESWSIQLPASPTGMEVFAAEELQTYVKKLAGWDLKVVRSNELANAKTFVIGRQPRNAAIVSMLDKEHAADPDAFARIVKDGSIAMVGSSDTATAYAVWDWLESLGVRWFFPTEKGEYVPQLKRIEIDEAETFEAPASQFRSIWPIATKDQGKPEYFGAVEHGMPAWQLFPLRMRSWTEHNPPSVKDRFRNLGWGHSYGYFLPSSKYYDQHPEWFNLIGGKRVKAGAQVCFTNEAAAHQFAENARAALKNSANADQRRVIVWVSPNDGRAWCECPNCQKLVDKDGSATSMVFNFANLVAKDLQANFPDVKILCYAYLNHSTPPDHIQLEPSVTPILTYWTANESFAFNNTKPGISAGNPKFLRSYKKWSEMSRRFGIYQYYGHYEWFTPWPMQTQMDHDLKELKKDPKYWGFSCEYHTNWATQNLGLYLLAKLGWNPSQDADVLVRDYCQKAYGPAAEPMYRYFNILQQAMDSTNRIGGDFWEVPYMLRPEVIVACDREISAAEAMMTQMDTNTRWRTELVCRGWRASADFAQVMERFNQGGDLKDLQFMREKMQRVKAALDSEWGPYIADASINLPRLNGLFPRYLTQLEALPPGEHKYSDNMNFGGVTKFYAKKDHLITNEWGWEVDPGQTGSLTLPLRAATGHNLKSLKFKWRTLGANPNFRYTLKVSTAKGEAKFEDQQVTDKEFEFPLTLLPASAAKLEIYATNISTKRALNLYGVDLNMVVE